MADKLYVEIGADIKALQASLNDATKELQDFRKDTEKGFEKAADSTKNLQSQLTNTRKGMALLNQHTAGLGEGFVKVAKAAKVGGAAMRSAMISTGIGALIVALGFVIEHWDTISGAITGATARAKDHATAIDDLTTALRIQKELRDDMTRDVDHSTKVAIANAKLEGQSISEQNDLLRTGLKEKQSLIEADLKEIGTKLSQSFDRQLTLRGESLDKELELEKSYEKEKTKLKLQLEKVTNQLELNALNEKVRINDQKIADEKRTAAEILKIREELENAPLSIFGEQLNAGAGFKFFGDLSADILPVALQTGEDIGEEFGAGVKEGMDTSLDEALTAAQLKLQQFNDGVTSAMQSAITAGITGVAEMAGELITSSGEGIEKSGAAMLGVLGGVMQSMGSALVALGVAGVAAEAALTTGQYWAAIGAGVALIIAGTAFSSAAKSAGETFSSGSSGGGSSASGSVGGSGSSSTSRSTASSGSSSTGGTYVFEISGDKLIGVLKNTLNRNKALGGSNLTFG